MNKKEAHAKVEALAKEITEILNEINEDYMMIVPTGDNEMAACIGDSNDLVSTMYVNVMSNENFGNSFAIIALDATDHFIHNFIDEEVVDDVITKLNDAYRERKMRLFPNQNVELN